MGIVGWTLPPLPATPWLASLGRHVHPVKDFVGKVLGLPPEERLLGSDRFTRARASGGRGHLPFSVFLNVGTTSLGLFPSGPIDEFRVFQRAFVSPHHEVEFLTRLEPGDAGTENYKAFALFRLAGGSRALADPARFPGLGEALERRYGLDALPEAREVLPHLAGAGRGEGALLSPRRSSRLWKKVSGRRFSYACVVEVLRHELSSEEKVAWIERAFEKTGEGIVHRYYLDSSRRAWLVRDHALHGKRLYLAETSEEALRAFTASDRHARRRAKAG